MQKRYVSSEYICFYSYACQCKESLNIVYLQNIFSCVSFYKVIQILLQCSPLAKTWSKNVVVLTQRSKHNEFVLLCKGKKQLCLKVRISFLICYLWVLFPTREQFPTAFFRCIFHYISHFTSSDCLPLRCPWRNLK